MNITTYHQLCIRSTVVMCHWVAWRHWSTRVITLSLPTYSWPLNRFNHHHHRTTLKKQTQSFPMSIAVSLQPEAFLWVLTEPGDVVTLDEFHGKFGKRYMKLITEVKSPWTFIPSDWYDNEHVPIRMSTWDILLNSQRLHWDISLTTSQIVFDEKMAP